MFPERQLDYLYTMRVESEKLRGHGPAQVARRAGAPRVGTAAAYVGAYAYRAQILSLLLILGLGIGFGQARLKIAAPILKVLTQSWEGLAARNGLAVEDVKAKVVVTDDRSTLVVEGTLVNLGSEAENARDVKISLVGPDRVERYAWVTHPSQTRLGVAERVRFSARLESPPAGIVDAIVSVVAAGH